MAWLGHLMFCRRRRKKKKKILGASNALRLILTPLPPPNIKFPPPPPFSYSVVWGVLNIRGRGLLPRLFHFHPYRHKP